MNQTIRQITRACLLTLAIAPFASSPAAPKIGVYPTLNGGSTGTTGYTAATKTADYETWLARPMDYVVQFVPVKTFAGNTETTIPSLTGTNWFFSQCAAFPTSFRSRMVLSVPMLPDDPSTTLAIGAAATNNYDSHWAAFSQRLISGGYGGCIIRLGWEFNGDWYRWTIKGASPNGVSNVTHFRNYWIRIVKAMRYLPGTTTPRPGANFKFCWNPTVGNPSKAGNPLSAYPGASYVDMIGLDIYDISPRYKQGYDAQGLPATDPNIVYYYGDSDMPVWMRDTIRTNAWKDQAIWGLYHLDWWRSQVRTSGSSVYGKPLCIPEWGLDQPGEKSSLHLQGGRDNPIFLQNFYNWITNPQYNDVSWVAYFERGNQSPERNTSLCFSNQFPIARNLFLQLF